MPIMKSLTLCPACDRQVDPDDPAAVQVKFGNSLRTACGPQCAEAIAEDEISTEIQELASRMARERFTE